MADPLDVVTVAAGRLGRGIALYVAAGFCILAGVAFATAAIFLSLSWSIGTVGAAVSVAVIFGFAAIVIVLVARHGPGRPREEPMAGMSDSEAIARLVGAFFMGYRVGSGPPRRG